MVAILKRTKWLTKESAFGPDFSEFPRKCTDHLDRTSESALVCFSTHVFSSFDDHLPESISFAAARSWRFMGLGHIIYPPYKPPYVNLHLGPPSDRSGQFPERCNPKWVRHQVRTGGRPFPFWKVTNKNWAVVFSDVVCCCELYCALKCLLQ